MQWIRRSMQLGQAVKNVQRLRHIITVFGKHGFVEVIDRMNLGRFLPNRLAAFAETQAEIPIAVRLRQAFEELGPTFVKLGQLLSSRPDLVPESFIEEFTKLQDDVQALPFETVQRTVEAQLGRPLADLYAEFSREPLAAASIGQVHTAILKTGEKVVVKVQRPEIDKIIDTDVSLLAFLAGLLEKYVPETRVVGPKTIVEEFFRTLAFELDFVIEANNIRRMTENMAPFPDVVLPKVYGELSGKKVLTLERFEGIRVNDLAAINAAGVDKKRIVDLGARAFFKSIMLDGLFHGDLHGGNLFVLPGNRIGMIDFGMVGRLSQKSRDQLANMLLSLLTEDYENLCYQYAELGSASATIDFDAYQRDVRNTLAPHLGLSLKDINVGRVLIDATKIATKYNVKVPGEWMLVFKAILSMEGMGRTLDPDFDLMAIGQEMVKELVKEQYSPARLGREFMWVAKDVASLMQVLPRQIRWMMRKFSSNDFAIEFKSPDLERIRVQLEVNARRTSLSVLIAGLFIASSIALSFASGHQVGGYPLISVIYFFIGAVLLFNLFLKSFR